MNAALIQYLESLPKEHLEVHLAAYPWFTAARVVLAKKQDTTEAIQQTVPYVADRKWFKNYLDQKAETIITTTKTLEEIKIPNKTLAEEKLEVAEKPLQENEKIKTPEILEVQQEILIEDVFETTNKENEEILANTILEKIENKAAMELQAEEIEEQELAEEKPPEAENFSFSGWLTHFNNAKIIEQNAPKSKPIKDELDILIKSNIPYEMLEQKIEAETNYSKGLNDFIAQQKQHKKRIVPTADFDEKTQLPITETIAVLLEKQGRIKQAISVYEQLSLKFPMKSTYFAAHIRKLRDKI